MLWLTFCEIPLWLSIICVSVKDSVVIKGIFLDMSVDAPARSMWQAIKQFNGYCVCGRCKETGEHLDLGCGKKEQQTKVPCVPFQQSFCGHNRTCWVKNTWGQRASPWSIKAKKSREKKCNFHFELKCACINLIFYIELGTVKVIQAWICSSKVVIKNNVLMTINHFK